MRGHWSGDTTNEYHQAVVRAATDMLKAGCRRRDLIAPIDARGLAAQSQAVVADFKLSMDRDDLVLRRLATIISSALFKRQVERIAIPNQRRFTNETEAIEWLLSMADQT